MLTEAFIPGDVLSDQERSEFVPVGFAETPHEAEQWKMLLEAHEIPALTQGRRDRSTGMPRPFRSVPVLVPDDYLDEASSLVKRLEAGSPASRESSELTTRFAKDASEEEEDDEFVFDEDEEDDLDDDSEEEFDDDPEDDEDDLAFDEEE